MTLEVMNATHATIYGLIIDPHNDQLPFALIDQLVQHCPGIAQDRVRVPFRLTFFRPFTGYRISIL